MANLRWKHALVFEAASGTNTFILDGDSGEGPSPVQTLAISLAGCMTVDVAHILTKGRHRFHELHSSIVAERAQTNPHRFVSVTLRFTVHGDVPRRAVGRAIDLSHEKYCSVWHSMRRDIAFTTEFDVRA
jgi:putative redox protein